MQTFEMGQSGLARRVPGALSAHIALALVSLSMLFPFVLIISASISVT